MAGQSLDSNVLVQVFRAMGKHLEWDTDVEVVIVGAAAMTLTGDMPPGRTTLDCDVMECEPEAAEKAVERAAAVAGREFDLPDQWFNSHVQWHLDTLPDRWRERRRFVGAYGKLRIFAAGRQDLIVMKLNSGRPRDLQDVAALLRVDDVAFIRECLTQLRQKSSLPEQLSEAFERLDALEPGQ